VITNLFLGLKQNFGGHGFKDDSEAETVTTRRLKTQGKDFYQRGTDKLVARYDKSLDVTENMRKNSGIAVEFSLNCSH
jgi:hypothetical protein